MTNKTSVTADQAKQKGQRFRPSQEIYHRIKHDSTLPFRPEDVIVAYEDRFMGVMEISLVTFEDPESEIPFHRIRYFRTTDGVVFWDRRRRINLLADPSASTQTEASTLTTQIDTESLTQFRTLSGRQKKRLLQAKRQAKREDTREQLVAEVEWEAEVELEQSTYLHSLLNRVERQQKRITPRNAHIPSPNSLTNDDNDFGLFVEVD